MAQTITSPAQQGYRPRATSHAHCDRCEVLDAYQVIRNDLQAEIDAKRAELARLSSGPALAQGGYVKMAVVQLLREMSPHVMTYGAMQVWLWGDESDHNRDNLRKQVDIIRRTRYGLQEGEEIVTVKGVGFRLVNSRSA
ncbi:MAG: hypothetical protein M3P51_02435 [Chloroflexota bacterium]|nr:hypothetical protein [Chloroflexota bacterium]